MSPKSDTTSALDALHSHRERYRSLAGFRVTTKASAPAHHCYDWSCLGCAEQMALAQCKLIAGDCLRSGITKLWLGVVAVGSEDVKVRHGIQTRVSMRATGRGRSPSSTLPIPTRRFDVCGKGLMAFLSDVDLSGHKPPLASDGRWLEIPEAMDELRRLLIDPATHTRHAVVGWDAPPRPKNRKAHRSISEALPSSDKVAIDPPSTSAEPPESPPVSLVATMPDLVRTTPHVLREGAEHLPNLAAISPKRDTRPSESSTQQLLHFEGEGPNSTWPRLSYTRITGTPGETYLAAQGIAVPLPDNCGVHWAQVLESQEMKAKRGAVALTLRDARGAPVAAYGIYTDGRTPRSLMLGLPQRGLFATPGALDADVVVICESGLDALALCDLGIPALATCDERTSLPTWVLERLTGRLLMLAPRLDDETEQRITALARNAAGHAQGVYRLLPTGKRHPGWVEYLDDMGARQARLSAIDGMRPRRETKVNV